MAFYPNTLTSFYDRATGDIVAINDVNDTQKEIEAIEVEMGKNPGGTYSDVAARLDASSPSESWVGYAVSAFTTSTSKNPTFTTVVDNSTGSAFTVANTPTSGVAVTANTSCVVSVSFTLGMARDALVTSGVTNFIGLSLNANTTASILSLTGLQMLSFAVGDTDVTASTASPASCAWAGPIESGDVIRPHLRFQSPTAAYTQGSFYVTLIGVI